MEHQQSPDKKWWDRWHKSTFSDPLHPHAFSFFPGLELIASKLGINSYKGFAVLVFLVMIIGFGFSMTRDWIYPEYETNTEIVIDSYKEMPEFRPAIILTVILIVGVVLILWWFRHRDDGGVWKTKN